MSKPDGGPAFPNTHKPPVAEPVGTIQHGSGWVGSSGMTLRDYFATHASEEDIRINGGHTPDRTRIFTREEARYRYADSMLEERAKP